MTMSSLTMKVENDMVNVEHDGSSIIAIFGEPIDFPIEHNPSVRARGMGMGKKRVMDILQSIDLMDFQANVGMLLRAELKDQQIPVPLPKDRYRVEIDVVSSRPASDIPLIGVIKSVIDGVNKEIIGNDVTIEEAFINYRIAGKSKRSYPSLSMDRLSVRIFSVDSGVAVPVVSFADAPLHIVPKIEPKILDKDIQSTWHIYAEELQAQATAALINDGMKIHTGSIRIDMTFTGIKVLGMDVDNMARGISRFYLDSECATTIYIPYIFASNTHSVYSREVPTLSCNNVYIR